MEEVEEVEDEAEVEEVEEEVGRWRGQRKVKSFLFLPRLHCNDQFFTLDIEER